MSLKFSKFIIIFCSFFIFFNIAVASAETVFTPQIGIGGEFKKNANITLSKSDTSYIAEYIKQIYKYLIGVAAIIAVVVMMLGGVTWMTAGGNPTRVSEAQAWIKASLTGLLLVMFSYVILRTVNPALVNFQVQSIATIKPQVIPNGCCITLSYNSLGVATQFCMLANEPDCVVGSSGSRETSFQNTKCSQVSGCITATGADCTTSNNLERCYTADTGTEGWCDGGACVTTKAPQGGRCGREGTIGICRLGACPSVGSRIWLGRSCEGLDWTCCD